MKKGIVKRIFALGLAFAVSASSLVYPSFAAENNRNEFLLCKAYNSYATYQTPSDGQFGVSGAYVESYNNGTDKALCLRVDGVNGSGNSASYALNSDAQKYVLSFDIFIKGSPVSGSVKLSGVSSGQYTAIEFDTEGMAYLSDGKRIFTLGKNKAAIDMCFDSKANKITVYVNGRCLFADWYVKIALPQNLSDLSFEFDPADGVTSEVYLDNVAVYEGSAPKSHSTIGASEALNPERLLRPSLGAGPVIYVNQNFNDGFTVKNAANGISVAYTDDEEEQGYISAKKEGYIAGAPQYSENIEVGGKSVFEIDLCINTPGNARSHVILFRGPDGVYSRLLTLTLDGNLCAGTNQGRVYKIPTRQWVNVGAVVDFKSHKFDLYVNRECVVKNIAFHRNIDSTANWAFGLIGNDEGGTTSGEVWFDNMRAYSGTKLLDSSEFSLDYGFDTMESGQYILDGSIAFNSGSQNVYYANTNHFKESAVILKNDKFYVDTVSASEAFGLSVTDSGTAVNIGTHAVTDTLRENSRTYISVKEAAEKLGMVYDEDVQRRFCIMNSNPEFMTDALSMVEASDLLLYEFVTPEEVAAKFASAKATHPRVLMNSDDVSRMKKLYAEDARFKHWADTVIASADAALAEQPIEYVLSSGTNQLLAQSRLALNRILPLGIAYMLKGDAKYAERAILEMKTACEFPDWNNMGHYLDTAEMATAVAIGYDWFYDVISEDERAYYAEKLYKHALRHSLNIYEGRGVGSDFWVQVDGNWGAVCNGGTALAAAAVYEYYPEQCAKIISYAPRSLAFMERTAFPGGGWEEGSDYVTYCMKYLSFMCNTLKNTVGTDFNVPLGMYDVADYMLSLDAPTGAFNFHDSLTEHTTSDIMSSVARLYGRTDILSARKEAVDEYDLVPTAIDLIYYLPDSECESADIALDYYSSPIETVTMKSSPYDKYGAFVGIQGGFAWGGHTHLDGGTFTVDLYGERWAPNLGQDSYGLDGYFGTVDTRYAYYRNRPESANVYVINPREGSYGQNIDSFAAITKFESKPRGAYAVMDLSEAYNEETVKAIRGIRLTDDRNSAVVRDEITFKEPDSEIYWFMNVPRSTEIQIVDHNTVRLVRPSGKVMELQIKVGGLSSYELLAMDCRPLPTSPDPAGQNQNGGLEKFTIHGFGTGDAYINVRFVNPNDIYYNVPYDGTQPISEWTIPDGGITEAPLLTDLTTGGVTIDGFDPRETAYTLPKAKNSAIEAVQAAAPEGAVVEIQQSYSADTPSVIKVYYPNEPQKCSIYTINYRVLADLPDINSKTRYTPAYVVASDNPQADNLDVNVVDNDLSSRWSAAGEQWISQEFAEAVRIDAVAVAVMNGTTRKSMFDIQVSDDGISWTTLKSVVTSGTTDDYEFYELGGVSAKHVRLLGHGNSENEWNSITEFAVLGNK